MKNQMPPERRGLITQVLRAMATEPAFQAIQVVHQMNQCPLPSR